MGCSGRSSSPHPHPPIVPGSDELAAAGTGFLRRSRVDERHMCRAEHSCCVRPALHLFTQHRPGQEGPLSPGKGQDAGPRRAFPHRPGAAGRFPAAGAATLGSYTFPPAPGTTFLGCWRGRAVLRGRVCTGTRLGCPSSGSPFPERRNEEEQHIRPVMRAKLHLTSLHLWEPFSMLPPPQLRKTLSSTRLFLGWDPSSFFVSPLSFLPSSAGPLCGDY